MQRLGAFRLSYGMRMQHISAPNIMLYYYIKDLCGSEGQARGSFGLLAWLIPVAVNPRLLGKGGGGVGICIIRVHRPMGTSHQSASHGQVVRVSVYLLSIV
jgi:hypothetical protein